MVQQKRRLNRYEKVFTVCHTMISRLNYFELLLRIGAKKMHQKKSETYSFCPPAEELILAYEDVCRPWLKLINDFQMLVKFAKYPIRMDLVDQALELDAFNNARMQKLLHF